jgi:hypothetical protein
MKLVINVLGSQVKESFAYGSMNDSNLCPLCGMRTAIKRSTQAHLRSDHKRRESEIADLLTRRQAGKRGYDAAAKSLNKMIEPSSWTPQSPLKSWNISAKLMDWLLFIEGPASAAKLHIRD